MRPIGTYELLRALLAVVAALSLAGGCAAVGKVGRSPLVPLTVASDAIAVEKFSVRFNHGDPALNEEMWAEIDEECLPVEMRLRLAANGFRAGVVGSQLPPALDHLLHDVPLSAAPRLPAQPQAADGADANGLYEPKPVDLLHEPVVRRGLWQTRSGNPGIIITAGEQARIPSVPVLVRGDDGRVTGRTYERVMGALTMKAYAEPDGRVRMELIPEIEHGDLRSRYTAENGMFKTDIRPERVIFKELRLEVVLAPGQMLVLSSRAEKPGSLGHHFLTAERPGEPLEQKLLLFRVAQAPQNLTFRSGEIPPADVE